MPSREEQEWLNAASKSRQQRTRSERAAEKGIRDRERDALSRATSTSQRRAIKEQADQERKQSGLLQNVDTNAPSETTSNRTGIDSDSNQRAIDGLRPTYSVIPEEGGGASLSGIEIIWADQTTTFVRATDILDGYDPDTDLYWSLVLNVSGGVFDKVVTTFDATQDIFEDDGGTPPTQTKYRFRVITQGLDEDNNAVNAPISLYGQYREVTTCINGAPFQRLTKVT